MTNGSDRRLWDRGLIADGQAIVRACVQRGRPGPYQIQAAINAVHSVAPSFDSTDWHVILTLYDQLYALTPTPVVALNPGSRARRSPRPRSRAGRSGRPAFFGPGQLLLVPRVTRRPATPPRPHHRSRGRLRHRPRPHREPGRTSLPRHAARRWHTDREGVTKSHSRGSWWLTGPSASAMRVRYPGAEDIAAASLDQDTGVVVESIRIWIACRGDRLRRTQTQRPLARDGRPSRKTKRTRNG